MSKKKTYNKNKKYFFELNEIKSNIFEIYAKNYEEASIKLAYFLIENEIITKENINNIIIRKI